MNILGPAAAALVFVPSLAKADFLADYLLVRYQGTVTYIEHDGLGYVPGDSVAGTARIYPRYAPADLFPDDPTYASYSNEDLLDLDGDPRFVQGYAPNGISTDIVRIWSSGADDGFFLVDNERSVPPAVGVGTRTIDMLMLSSSRFSFATDDSLYQQFDRSGERVGMGQLSSSAERYENGRPQELLFSGMVAFVLQKLSVTPKSCSP